jgi:hypothetical protein
VDREGQGEESAVHRDFRREREAQQKIGDLPASGARPGEAADAGARGRRGSAIAATQRASRDSRRSARNRSRASAARGSPTPRPRSARPERRPRWPGARAAARPGRGSGGRRIRRSPESVGAPAGRADRIEVGVDCRPSRGRIRRPRP